MTAVTVLGRLLASRLLPRQCLANPFRGARRWRRRFSYNGVQFGARISKPSVVMIRPIDSSAHPLQPIADAGGTDPGFASAKVGARRLPLVPDAAREVVPDRQTKSAPETHCSTRRVA